jgi:VIT1/CCC1 family predicted Fe2+/Mn2+ transporter
MFGGILFVLSMRISGDAKLALVAWGILLAIVGAIVGALIGAKRRNRDRDE